MLCFKRESLAESAPNSLSSAAKLIELALAHLSQAERNSLSSNGTLRNRLRPVSEVRTEPVHSKRLHFLCKDESWAGEGCFLSFQSQPEEFCLKMLWVQLSLFKAKSGNTQEAVPEQFESFRASLGSLSP